MVEDDDRTIPAYYGPWPTILGTLFGLGLTLFMFMLADGFTH
ncbi:MAG TPA: hypothetical protein VMX97_14860 [Hyphomicrobiaceae bacterium]|nr:hypothetical protein [Hyphomicrobiaceae bacterium]